MIHKSLVAVLFIVALLAVGLGQATATPAFSGKWQLSVCTDPDRTSCATHCYIFTRTAGTVSGSNTSGTWHDPSSFALDGKWLQLGDRLIIWGSSPTGPLNSAAFFRGSIVSSTVINGDSFVLFPLPNGSALTGNWTAQKVGNC